MPSLAVSIRVTSCIVVLGLGLHAATLTSRISGLGDHHDWLEVVRFCAFSITAVLILIVAHLRCLVREALDYAPMPASDACVVLLCQCCSLSQMARELEIENPFSMQDSIGAMPSRCRGMDR